VAQTIEDYANRSECVFGFAEVKFKQLFPIAPSMDYALGGVASDEIASKEDGLTLDAVVTLSEEALVLYVKVLTLLARAMEIAGAWWTRKHRGESCASAPQTGRESTPSQIARVNSAVQWVRHRFNETLEKTEAVRLKLVEAQKLLPGDHPSHPNNHGDDSISSAGSGVKQVFLTPGISAEKLMYDRALDMSRTAAIDEIANEHLPDCEAYYTTAIRMLEAVLEVDDDTQKARSAGSSKDVKEESRDDISSDLDTDDRKVVLRSRFSRTIKVENSY
jgi:serine/threonine-protein kinase ULK/ATG1